MKPRPTALALEFITQRLRLIQLTNQAKKDQSEQLQLTKKTAEKALKKCERRYEQLENQLEKYDAPQVPVKGVEHSDDNEDEVPVPTAQEILATKLTMMTTQITTSEEELQAAHTEDHKEGHGLDEPKAARHEDDRGKLA